MQEELIAANWRDLIRPRRLDLEEDSLASTYGRFSCEPLERSFGTTLGNALRRVMLSSLQGAAITSVRMQGVLHEFSTIPGVMEDVSEIVLNLKEVRMRMHAEGPRRVRIAAYMTPWRSVRQQWPHAVLRHLRLAIPVHHRCTACAVQTIQDTGIRDGSAPPRT